MIIKELVTDPEVLVDTGLFNVKANPGRTAAIRQNLTDTLNSLEDRIFLCNNELGERERAFALKFQDQIKLYFNPAFKRREKIFINREKDVFNGKEYFIPRYSSVDIVYQDEDGQVLCDRLNEVASVVICQAMSLLDGIRTSDIGLEILDGFDDFTEDEKAEILSDYINWLKAGAEELDQELMGDSETESTWSRAKFIQGVSDGTIELEETPPSNNEKKRWKKYFKAIKDKVSRNKFWNKLRGKK